MKPYQILKFENILAFVTCDDLNIGLSEKMLK